jgi:hypothetical protein
LTTTSRTNLPEPLSGLPDKPEVELGAGQPWLTIGEINQLVRLQGLAPRLARAWVINELVHTIALDPDLEEQLIQEFITAQGIQSDDGLDAWLQRQRLLRKDLPILATQSARIDQFLRSRWGDELEVHFLRRKAELDQVVYFLLRVSERNLAEELHQRLRDDGADFGDLAVQYAEGQERLSRGLIGPLPITAAHPTISSRLRIGQPGQLWPPFQVEGVWVLLRLEQRLPARLNEQMRTRMMNELFEQWVESRVELILAGEPLPSLPPLQQP